MLTSTFTSTAGCVALGDYCGMSFSVWMSCWPLTLRAQNQIWDQPYIPGKQGVPLSNRNMYLASVMTCSPVVN